MRIAPERGLSTATYGVRWRSLIAVRIVSTDGALVSLPDSSLNILQENPTVVGCGCISFPLTNTEGDPERPRATAFSTSTM